MFPADGWHIEALAAENASDATALHAKCFVRSWPLEDFQRYVVDTATHVLLARSDQRGAAGLAVARAGGGEGEILTITTDPSLRRKGIARLLLSSLIERLSEADIDALFLEVGETNKAAIALYTSFGFERVGRRAAYYRHADGCEDALIMRRRLD